MFSKGSRAAKAAQGLAAAINVATGTAVLGDKGSPAPPAAANSAKGTTSSLENIPKSTPTGAENGASEGLEDLGGEPSPMDLDSDFERDAAGSFSPLQFETGTSREPPSTSPTQRQIPQPAAPSPGSMDVDSDLQDELGSQGRNLSLPLAGRSPTNAITRTKFSVGKLKTSALKTKSIGSSSSTESDTSSSESSSEGDSDVEKQRLHAGRLIKPLAATATASRPTSLHGKPLRPVAKPKSAPSSQVKRSLPSASKAKGMSRHLEQKGVLKRKGEVLEEKPLQPIDFIDLTTDSWLRQSLTDDMEVLKAQRFNI
jgi:hypothetical protein